MATSEPPPARREQEIATCEPPPVRREPATLQVANFKDELRLGEEACLAAPNPHAELLLRGGFVPTRDEQSALNGNTQAATPNAFTFSRTFSCRNVTNVYQMLDDLASYYGERWQGFGHPLFLRAHAQLWETHRRSRVLRDEATKTAVKQAFRSITFGFTRLE